MKHEVELKIQSYLDQQLTGSEMHEVAELISRDSAARSLHESLASVKTLLAENEPDHQVPETREFYWSTIEREIRRQEAKAKPARWFGLDLRNWWIRLAGAGAVMGLVAAVVLSIQRPVDSMTSSSPQEVESPADMSAITFHSEEANMTVVWVQAHGTN